METVYEILKEVLALRLRALLKRLTLKTALITLLTLLISVMSCAQGLDREKLDLFFDRLEENKEGMASLMISRDGQAIYTRSMGHSRKEGGAEIPNTLETRHRIGSITKMFTAVMVLQLVEEGRLKLDDRLDQFFPQIKNASKMSIANMLAHRSGIQDIYSAPRLRPRRTAPISKEALLAITARGASDFEPGTQYAYSNSGYFLLACLVEKLTGQSYELALKKRILSKVGLENTYMPKGPIDAGKNESFPFRRFADWRRVEETHASILFGSGSMVSIPADLTAFVEALFSEKLINTALFEQMQTTQDGYGLGLDTFTFADKTFYGHTGGIDGFGSWLAYLPEEKLTIAYTANGKSYPVSKIISSVVNIYFGKAVEFPDFGAISVGPEVLDQYTGLYERTGAPVSFEISRKDNVLFISINGRPATALKTISDTQFKLESQAMTLVFDVEQMQMTIKRGGGSRVFTKQND